ncbi:hypothetical protein L596_010691 [Steinernema carpocapsae]|uniref:Uncharacterized protein n=1 Tax=Steinernema carpocapsae TaxID=34508 RepID=A0A4U5PJ82_STECR|nr:hypothetical protein L596_010691 [Steinernema carpocapsae]
MLKNWLLHKANGHQCVHSSLEFDPMEDEESYAIQCDPVQQRGRGLASLPQAVDEELCECPRTAGHVVVVATRNEIVEREARCVKVTQATSTTLVSMLSRHAVAVRRVDGSEPRLDFKRQMRQASECNYTVHRLI